MKDPKTIRDDWFRLRSTEKGLHALDLAERIGVSECELLASACGSAAEIAVTRLHAAWPELLKKLPRLGLVKTVTRNAHAVIEVEGTYDNVEFFGSMGQSVSTIDLRIFAQRWAHGFAVREETKRGVSRGLQFFDAAGTAIHKVYLRESSDHAFFDVLVAEHTAVDQSPVQRVDAAPDAPATATDAEVDVAALRTAWLAMTDTHEFFGLLRTFRLARTQALRLAGMALATPVAIESLEKVLFRAAGEGLPIMVFVGNRGIIQIHSGPVVRVKAMGPWINVLDPGFDLHVRTDRIASAWVVRKPTRDGVVTALEIYDGAGEQIALLVGKRKPNAAEDPAWRALVESLAVEVSS